MYGVHTNYKSWYFTMCNLEIEAAELLNPEQKKIVPWQLGLQPRGEAMFEVSQEFNILDCNTMDIKPGELKKVTRILEWLITSSEAVFVS